MKTSKSRRDDGIKKDSSNSSSGDDGRAEKPKTFGSGSSFKSYRENRSKDSLAKKSFVKKPSARTASSGSGDHGFSAESGESSVRPARVSGSKTGTFSRIGSGRATSSFKGTGGEGNRSASGYKGPMADRESTSFRGKADSRPQRSSASSRESTGYKGKPDSRTERPAFGSRESTGYKGKTDSRSERPSYSDGYKAKSDPRGERSSSGERESTYKGKTSGSERTKYGERSSAPESKSYITRGAERARAPRREAAERSDAPRDSRPFATRNSEENSGIRLSSPYKGSKAENTYLAGKPERKRSYDFDDEAEAKPIKRNATTTHYNKTEVKPAPYEKTGPKGRLSKPRAEAAEGTFKERKPRSEAQEGTFKERQAARNSDAAAAAKEARPAKRLNADFDEYKNSSRVSTGSRPFDKPVKTTRTNAKVDQAAERYSKGTAKPAMGTRLNKYIANSGLCARRKADEMIANGEIRVNGTEITEMGYIVQPGDKVQFHDKVLKAEEMVYVLMNKPKDFITTTDDPQERRTVMELLNGATPHRIYPVGRLDRNTTGLLLFTNDGSLAEKLSHPSSNINKLYHVTLDKPLTKVDFDKVTEGITLEDGLITVDELAFVDGMSKKEVGIRIHSGKNRIVRRIFESMGYDVLKLDRVIYAGLSKKDLTRGRWRHLSAKEIISLKHFTK